MPADIRRCVIAALPNACEVLVLGMRVVLTPALDSARPKNMKLHPQYPFPQTLGQSGPSRE